MHLSILEALLAVAALVAAWAVWWLMPPKFASHAMLTSDEKRAGVEDAYRRSIAQAIAGLAFIFTISFTAAQYRLAQETERADRYQKQFDALKGSDVPPHIGGIFGLRQLGEDSPDWEGTILTALSAAAVSFSASSSVGTRGHPDALAAFETVALAKAPIATPEDVKSNRDPRERRGDELRFWFSEGRFAGARIANAHLEHADLSCADISGIDAPGAHFGYTDLAFSTARAANLGKADFRGARLVGADFGEGPGIATPALVTGAPIGTQASNAIFDTGNLAKVNFANANLQGASFLDANLQSAKFPFACMDESTKIRGTNLTDAHFYAAWLRKVDFGPVLNVDRAPPPMLRGSASTVTPQQQVQLSINHQITTLVRADFRQANLREANFRFALLRGANFKDANLTMADFTGADVSDGAFAKAYLCHTRFPDGSSHDDSCKQRWVYPDRTIRSCDNQFDQFGASFRPNSAQDLHYSEWDNDTRALIRTGQLPSNVNTPAPEPVNELYTTACRHP